jgi:hypothetical protein
MIDMSVLPSLRVAIVLVAALWCLEPFAQTGPDLYWVQFTDKDQTPYSIDAPEAFLSARSIARRQAQGVAIDELDLPVDPAYIEAVLALGDVQLVNRSKWFNAITIRTTDPLVLEAITELPFVNTLRDAIRHQGTDIVPDKFGATAPVGPRGGSPEDYGGSFRQIEMLNGHLLHAMEAKGQGMLIGVLDSGFDNVDSIAAFDALRSRDGIVAVRDMVEHDGDVFMDHWHGRSVLGCMAGSIPGSLLGTAPEADYVLVRTETVEFEHVVEEDNWVAGAEFCDSLGCDVLNTSLGYTRFDDGLNDHAYTDLDGQTSRISIAAGIASRKGMIPVSSAGNSGSSEWYYISAPADAIDILTVGAVGDQEQSAPFSSRGPSADGRVKPDVSTMGWGVTGINAAGTGVDLLNGTSFSSPILAGLVACLWQLHPDRSAQQIMDAVRRSASHWSDPNDSLGYGIPDFLQAHDRLLATVGVAEPVVGVVPLLYPQPFQDQLTVVSPKGWTGTTGFRLMDAAGRVVWSTSVAMPPNGSVRLQFATNSPAPGSYVLVMENAAGRSASVVWRNP